jgi:hypothetical protein
MKTAAKMNKHKAQTTLLKLFSLRIFHFSLLEMGMPAAGHDPFGLSRPFVAGPANGVSPGSLLLNPATTSAICKSGKLRPCI